MTTRIIETEPGRAALISLIQARPLPMTVQVLKGRKRSLEQNATQYMWHDEAANQLLDNTADWYRGYCKLHFGVPILRTVQGSGLMEGGSFAWINSRTAVVGRSIRVNEAGVQPLPGTTSSMNLR